MLKVSADFRRGEHRGRHTFAIDKNRPVAEDAIGEGMAFANRDRRQIDAVGEVAGGVNGRDVGRLSFIDFDGSVSINGDTCALKAALSFVRSTPSDNKNLIDDKVVAVRERNIDCAPALFDTLG